MTTGPSESFSLIVGDELDSLKLRLAEWCENVAKERENILREELREEIEDLRKENTKLLGKLRSEQDAAKDRAFVPKSPKIRPFEQIVSIDGDKPCEVHEMNVADLEDGDEDVRNRNSSFADTGRFQLLPELLVDQWTGDDEIKKHHNDAYYERDHLEEFKRPVMQCVFDPASTFKLCWDISGIPILAWDVLTIPMQVFDIGEAGIQIMDGAGWVTLLYWTFDMPVTFRTGYFDSEGDLVMEKKRIARHYLRGPFVLDSVIILGDWLTVIIERIGSSAPGFLSNLAVLRVLRIARFARLLRMKKLKAMIQSLEDCIDNEWLLVCLNLMAKVLSILIINHYVGCGWFFLGSHSHAVSEYRWLGAVPYPQYDYKRYDADGVESQQKMSDASWDYQYTTSLHWAIAQFTPGPQNIQPQNSFERVYVVFILLFGMVVFSSFIASVTQARMQMSKLMSKFERDTWLLRKFCRQNRISRVLQVHMRRYIDLVLIPNYHKLAVTDIVLLPKLSLHLRSQVTAELVSKTLVLHPFFNKCFTLSEAVMLHICNHAIEKLSLARGDVAFIGGSVAQLMFFVTSGCLDYIPLHKHVEEMKVPEQHWCCEAVLWTKWTHQGQLQSSIESTAIGIHGAKFRKGMQDHALIMPFVRVYGKMFCEGLSNECEVYTSDNSGVNHPTDLHEQVSLDLDMSKCNAKRDGASRHGVHNAMNQFMEDLMPAVETQGDAVEAAAFEASAAAAAASDAVVEAKNSADLDKAEAAGFAAILANASG